MPVGVLLIFKTIRYRSEDKSMRCQTCIMGFTRYYSRIIFQDGKTLLNGIPRTHTDLMLLSEAEGLFSSTSGTFVIIDGPIGTEFEGGYHHLYVPLPRCDLKSFSNKNYNWFIHQHFPTLARLMSENNNDGIIPSLELLLSLLPKVTYGDKIQKSAEWFHRYMSEYQVFIHDVIAISWCSRHCLISIWFLALTRSPLWLQTSSRPRIRF